MDKLKPIQAYRRNWHTNDIVRYFDGTLYKIIKVILVVNMHKQEQQEIVTYQKLDSTDELLTISRTDFESEVDKEEYPNAIQRWKFEKVNL